MDIITSHTNADFDALASMVAAKKLYPEATLVFPGSQEKSMRDFFLESAFYALEVERLRNVDVDTVSKLIIVDNRSPSRLGKLSDALKRPGVEIHIYDHHPSGEGDIKGDREIVEEVGATTTIMVELLQKRGLDISPLEATVFALGIYEETGSLTYVSTTARDAQAAAYLISLGAQLNIVSDFISRELSQEQITVLNGLMEAATSYDISGVRIVISAIDTASYIPDLANIAHKMRDTKGLDVLFLVVQMNDKTHIVGRSRIPRVNAGRVLEELGGGGHATAASAVVKDMTYLQAKEKLIDILKRHIKPGRSAVDIMTSPVKTIPDTMTLSEAGDCNDPLQRECAAGRERGKIPGYYNPGNRSKSSRSRPGKTKSPGIMITGGPVASPDMPTSRVENTMIEEHQRFIPVLDSAGALVGAITRTDLLRSLHEERLSEVRDGDEGSLRSVRNVKHMLEERLPHDVTAALKKIGEVADEAGFPVYLVGGIVRDLFLHGSEP